MGLRLRKRSVVEMTAYFPAHGKRNTSGTLLFGIKRSMATKRVKESTSKANRS